MEDTDFNYDLCMVWLAKSDTFSLNYTIGYFIQAFTPPRHQDHAQSGSGQPASGGCADSAGCTGDQGGFPYPIRFKFGFHSQFEIPG